MNLKYLLGAVGVAAVGAISGGTYALGHHNAAPRVALATPAASPSPTTSMSTLSPTTSATLTPVSSPRVITHTVTQAVTATPKPTPVPMCDQTIYVCATPKPIATPKPTPAPTPSAACLAARSQYDPAKLAEYNTARQKDTAQLMQDQTALEAANNKVFSDGLALAMAERANNQSQIQADQTTMNNDEATATALGNEVTQDQANETRDSVAYQSEVNAENAVTTECVEKGEAP